MGEERDMLVEEKDLGEGEESVKRKRRKGEHSTDAAAERVDCEEGEGEVKKSKKRKKHKRECSPAPAHEQPELAHTAENIEDPEPLVKKKKKSRKEKDLVQVVAGAHNGGEQEDLSKNKEELTAEAEAVLEGEKVGTESKKSKKKKKKDEKTTETPEEEQAGKIPEDQVVNACSEEKFKKKKSKKSKKEKSSDEEKESVEDSGCEEVAEVKVKKTKKSKKEKVKSDDGENSVVKIKTENDNLEATGASDLDHEVAVKEVEPSIASINDVNPSDVVKKKKKKSKKNKTSEEEDQPSNVPADKVLKMNYPEAPGILKGSNLLAIPGYGAK